MMVFPFVASNTFQLKKRKKRAFFNLSFLFGKLSHVLCKTTGAGDAHS